MRRKPVDDGRSLFDGVDDESDSGSGSDSPDSSSRSVAVGQAVEWHEVPQALYLSWSAARQYAYCAERDLRASIEFATSPEEEKWFYDRAVSYKRMMGACLPTRS